MKTVIDFLTQLTDNNNKEWFNTNKQFYLEALDQFNDFAQKLIDNIPSVDPATANLTLKDCTYRIYRDTRFSNDKTPYKTYMGVYMAPQGKKSGYAGYYFHIEPKRTSDQWLGNMLCGGLHCPEPKVLLSVRQEVFDNPETLLTNIKKAKGFKLDQADSLKKVPRGFPSDFEYAEYLKYRNYLLCQYPSNETLLSDNLVEYVLKELKKTAPFVAQINRAVQFAKEEM